MTIIQKALILEDHHETRNILNDILSEMIPQTEIFEAATLRQARKLLYQQDTFDLALIDIGLPDGNGIDFVVELIRQSPSSYVVMCTIYDDDKHLFKALRAGANGYLVKEHSKSELTTMLQGILNGKPPLSPGVAQHILDSFHQSTRQLERLQLRSREIEVLTLLAKGYSCKEIAIILKLKTNTIRWYIKQVYQKLDIHSRAEATLEASRMGFVL